MLARRHQPVAQRVAGPAEAQVPKSFGEPEQRQPGRLVDGIDERPVAARAHATPMPIPALREDVRAGQQRVEGNGRGRSRGAFQKRSSVDGRHDVLRAGLS
jgi:hypothetical protein